ncbi:adenosylcobinamide amidohydrolase [Streptomyces daliensis]
MHPSLHWSAALPVLVWRFPRPLLTVSSGPYGGGLGERRWVLNATVSPDADLSAPEAHLRRVGEELGCAGPGTGLMTAVDVRHRVTRNEDGVTVTATTGVGVPLWAAAPEPTVAAPAPGTPGTVNVVAALPVRLSEAAMINAVATVTEAKTQALLEAGVPGTGTCTDAVVLVCPPHGPAESYGGTRSRIGAPLARAVHAAVREGLRVPEPQHHTYARVTSPGG